MIACGGSDGLSVVGALAQRNRGVVAFSSGNHAQGVAAAAAMFGVKAVIAMPSDAPAMKIANVREMGRRGALDRFRTTAWPSLPLTWKKAWWWCRLRRPAIITGQGTIGLELMRQAKALGVSLDAVVIPCGGGGLSSGISVAVKDASPDSAVWAVEPEHFDDTRRSLIEGRQGVGTNPATPRSATRS